MPMSRRCIPLLFRRELDLPLLRYWYFLLRRRQLKAAAVVVQDNTTTHAFYMDNQTIPNIVHSSN